jgi:hypothetical protein
MDVAVRDEPEVEIEHLLVTEVDPGASTPISSDRNDAGGPP